MTLKEKFLSIKTYEEYDPRREEFKDLDISDPEVMNHYNELFGTLDDDGIEDGFIVDVYENKR